MTAPVSTGEGLAAYAADELARAIDCLGWRAGHLHEGVHQARKSLRRLRATLALGGSALGRDAPAVDREVRRINRRLSTLRDAHALVEAVDRLIAMTGDDATLRLLRRARRVAGIERARQARIAVAEDPGMIDRRHRLEALRAGISALPWHAIGPEQVIEQAEHSAARMTRAAARALTAASDDNDWHRWRRRARRLSQQRRALEACGITAPKGARSEKRIAQLLGEAQDYTLLCEHCRAPSIFNDADRRALRALAESGTRRLRKRIAAAAH